MPDVFDDPSGPGEEGKDPVERVRASARQELPKRFYETASVAADDAGGWHVLLDGRPVRTPARRLLAVPDERVAERLAAEWQGQGARIDPGTMPLTRLVNAALDGVADDPEAVVEDTAKYAGSDLLFYRADGPERLVARQTAVWDPIVAWAESRFGVRFRLAEGVMPIVQDERAVASVAEALPRDPLQLAGLNIATSLLGSALLAVAVLEARVSADEAWAAAHLDEDWNIELWGADEEAAARRRYRRAEFDAAVLLMGR